MTEKPPAPLEWHPAYRDRAWLIDWLEGRRHGLSMNLVLPNLRSPLISGIADPHEPPKDTSSSTTTLTRQKACGAAPYVGRPFVYWWWCAVDELGRAISGEARIRHADPDFTFCYGSYEYADNTRNGHDPNTPVWP